MKANQVAYKTGSKQKELKYANQNIEFLVRIWRAWVERTDLH